MKSFEELTVDVLQWAEERGIFAKATPLAQLNKTQEELDETIQAVKDEDEVEIADGVKVRVIKSTVATVISKTETKK